mgnify:CR=1 FL=1
MERLLDIFISLSLIILLFPFLILISFILMITGEKKILYLQQRVGRKKINFNLIKFATMLENSPNIGTKTITLKNDPRVLPFGKFLRLTKLNELTQLFNILKGDMSFVGPRPLTLENFNLYEDNIKNIIIKVRPGLTGIGSIFFRNEEEILNGSNSLKFYKENISPYKGKLENWFVNNKNLLVYLKTLILTGIILFYPNKNLLFIFFKGIPQPPKILL